VLDNEETNMSNNSIDGLRQASAEEFSSRSAKLLAEEAIKWRDFANRLRAEGVPAASIDVGEAEAMAHDFWADARLLDEVYEQGSQPRRMGYFPFPFPLAQVRNT
jgi:hypothetical protein